MLCYRWVMVTACCLALCLGHHGLAQTRGGGGAAGGGAAGRAGSPAAGPRGNTGPAPQVGGTQNAGPHAGPRSVAGALAQPTQQVGGSPNTANPNIRPASSANPSAQPRFPNANPSAQPRLPNPNPSALRRAPSANPSSQRSQFAAPRVGIPNQPIAPLLPLQSPAAAGVAAPGRTVIPVPRPATINQTAVVVPRTALDNLGLSVALRDNRLNVTDVAANQLAASFGFQPGDHVIAVGGTTVLTTQQLLDQLAAVRAAAGDGLVDIRVRSRRPAADIAARPVGAAVGYETRRSRRGGPVEHGGGRVPGGPCPVEPGRSDRDHQRTASLFVGGCAGEAARRHAVLQRGDADDPPGTACWNSPTSGPATSQP